MSRVIITYITWWVIWTLALTYVLTDLAIPFRVALADAVMNNMLLAGTGVLLYNIIRFYQPRRDQLFYLRLWAVLIAIVLTVVFNLLMSATFSWNEAYQEILSKGAIIRFCYFQLMIALIVMINVLWFSLTESHGQETRQAAAEKLAREAELSTLRQQLQPHFLFNSLNSISALAGSDPGQARKMIQQLSDFLRGTLKKDEQSLVTLREELHHLELYLSIEKVRFGDRLQTQTTCEEKNLDARIPPLLLQPVLENAIRFGLYDTIGEILISLSITHDDNDIIATVTNPYDPETATPTGTGFGLSSAQRRLYLLFGRSDLLQTQATARIFTTTIRIPQS
jgi:sensor histidine kinase YesM